MWTCDQQLIISFQNGPSLEKAQLQTSWSQLRLKDCHIEGINNAKPDFIRRNNFDARNDTNSATLAPKASARWACVCT